MIKFKQLNYHNLAIVLPFFKSKNSQMCDFTLGEKFIWEKQYKTMFDIVDDTLIMMENYGEEKWCFYFPIGHNIDFALREIEQYVLKRGIRLEFCCLNQDETEILKKRYPHFEIVNNIDWDDYLYDANALMNFSGKHLSGQRNHLHHFINTYSNYTFSIANKDDISSLHGFMYNLKNNLLFPNEHAEYEFEMADVLLDYALKLGFTVGLIKIENEIIGFCIGEIINDTLFVHVEKANAKYDGIYQALVINFANVFQGKIQFINREEDDGDMGLRMSKTQYHPLMKVQKTFMYIRNNIDLLEDMPVLITERLIIKELDRKDANTYARLATNDLLNKLWGYDYKEDLHEDDIPNGDYFYEVLENDYKLKNDVSFMLYLKDSTFIGEIVAYEFTLDNSLTLGFRLFKQYQHLGYMQEALNEVVVYLFKKLHVNYISSKCYKDNLASKHLMEKIGYKLISNDDEFYYYQLHLIMANN